MGVVIESSMSVRAAKVSGHHKADIEIAVTSVSGCKKSVRVSLKLVTTSTGFNQIDKREVDKYVEMWGITSDVERLLKLFTGRIKPTANGLKDPRRMSFNEMERTEKEQVVRFFSTRKRSIISDLLKGSDEYSADYFMVVWKKPGEELKWVIKDIESVVDFYGAGEVEISKRGSLNIGRVGMQRKGGDGGRPSAQMLQFKIDPLALFRQ